MRRPGPAGSAVPARAYEQGVTSTATSKVISGMDYARRADPLPLDWGGHLLLLYRSEPERQARLTTWVRQGLERDEKVIHVVAHEAAGQAALSMLARRGIDVATALSQDRLEVLPLALVSEHRLALSVERALTAGFRAVRICVATSPGPPAIAAVAETDVEPGVEADAEAAAEESAEESVEEHTEGDATTDDPARAVTSDAGSAGSDLEHEIERLCRTHPLSALCQYRQKAMTHERLRRYVASHLDGIWQRQLTIVRRDGYLQVGGEVDISNDQLFMVVMQCAADAATTVLCLDLSSLRFLTAAGCRALIDGTAKLRSRGGMLVISSPQPLVERVLQIVGLDRLDGIDLQSRWR